MTARRHRVRPKWGAGRIAKVLAAAAAVLFLGWLAVRSATMNALGRDNPFLAAAVAPDDPRAGIELAMIEFAIRNGRVGDAARARALAALDRAPLADEPFLLAGVNAAARGDAALSESLLTEARRRNPRSRLTRLLLLDRYLRTGRSEQAGVELAVLARLIPETSTALIPQLSQLALDAKTRPGLARMLRRNPDIRDQLLAALAAKPADAEMVVQFAAAAGSGGDPARPPVWQAKLLEGLIEHGEVDRAYGLWRGFLHQGADAAKNGGVYDPEFRGAPGAAPFNWGFYTGNEGAAERGSGGALQVQYYGRAQINLAAQLLLLRPGSYRLEFQANGDAKGDGSRLAWTVTCVGASAPALQIVLKDVQSTRRTFAGAFTVPSDCHAQWLRLQGIPGDVAAEQDATIFAVRIVPAAAAR